ncbi:MAG: ABC transporter ATP-binding protein [Betaproteobacteria bacterium]|nr:ABC transporter ATP-binding protein [Betaproteobacteria bacterium]
MGNAAPATLSLRNVSLSFGGLRVLNDVSFDADPGKLLALIGPNGAGKTSVLNCICGIYKPNVGIIRFNERDIARGKPHEIAAAGVARTFQHGELFPHMSVLDNLMVGRHAKMTSGVAAGALFTRRVRDEEATHRRAIEEILEFVELERIRHQPVGDLPFGVQKIVGFARALALDPKILLLDEPSAGLNREEREDLARHILRIRHELGITMIWVEHDMQMVADLADRLYVLSYGEFLAEGSPQQVLGDPKVIAAYLGRAHG